MELIGSAASSKDRYMEKTGAEAHIDLLGKVARDRITGFQGVAASISFDLYGCIQVALAPPVDKDGKLMDGRYFDIHRLEVVDHARKMPIPSWAGLPTFGTTPEAHAHGCEDKSAIKQG